ncbi:LmeA family phospholipid-binding protein [Gordonia aurantiaca]|uniref:LmeA family phospholipid-binding protein n=1 Tax=Gordonia sp. B21 TaxID=3151852 RepID=UPI0032650C5F
MSDDTTPEGPAPENATPEGAAPENVTREGAAPENVTREGAAPDRPGDEWRPVGGDDAASTGETRHLPTEKLPPGPIPPAPQAYSQVPPSEADTTDLSGGSRPPTAVYGPGDQPFTDTSSAPLGPDPTGSGQVMYSPAGRRSTGKIVALSLVAVLLVGVIAAVGGELYLRNKVTDCLEKSFSGLTGVPTSVSLSRKPIILQGTGDIPFVQVDTKDDSSPDAVRLHMRADGISGDDTTTDIRSLQGQGFVPYERIVELSKENAPAAGQGTGNGAAQVGTVEEITGNATDGTFDVQASFPVMFFAVPVSATIKPVVNDGRVDFEVVKASALVFGIPPDFAQQIVDQVTESALGPFFDEVQVDQLKVTDTGLEFAISGSDVQLTSEMTGNQQSSCA